VTVPIGVALEDEVEGSMTKVAEIKKVRVGVKRDCGGDEDNSELSTMIILFVWKT